MAPMYIVGLMTFLIVLGLGLSPLPRDSDAGQYLTAPGASTVIIAATYTIGIARGSRCGGCLPRQFLCSDGVERSPCDAKN